MVDQRDISIMQMYTIKKIHILHGRNIEKNINKYTNINVFQWDCKCKLIPSEVRD